MVCHHSPAPRPTTATADRRRRQSRCRRPPWATSPRSSDDDYFTFTVDNDTGIFIFTTSYVSGFLPTTGDLWNDSGSVIKTGRDQFGNAGAR